METRQQAVLQYLKRLQECLHLTWREAAVGSRTLVDSLVLINPNWLPDDYDRELALNLVPFRGARSPYPCQSRLIWGYECPLTDEAVEADHLFPRSLGGPTVAANQLPLCRIHNAWKCADLLAFPWENGEPLWLDDQLTTVRQLGLTDQRLNWYS